MSPSLDETVCQCRCGAVYLRTHGNQRYCTRQCAQRHGHAAYRERNRPTLALKARIAYARAKRKGLA